MTGGAHGIGRACARWLAAEGAAVAVADIDVDAATVVAAELTGAGAEAIAVDCDVTSAGSVAAAVDRAVGHFGGGDVLVNTAGGDAIAADPDNPDDAAWITGVTLPIDGGLLAAGPIRW